MRSPSPSSVLWKVTRVVCVANLVLEGTVERLFVDQSYCDESVGMFIVRGDNIALAGALVSLAYPSSKASRTDRNGVYDSTPTETHSKA